MTFLRLVLALCVAAACAPAPADRLPAPGATALRSAGIPVPHGAVLVRDAEGGPDKRPMLAVNADQPMNPASVMKLLTTGAALDLLGPAYTWATTAYAEGPLADGVLQGDLYLRGSGDPKLGFEQFWLLLRQLRDHGVRTIRGDLVLDRSAFQVPAEDPAAFDNKPMRPYNVAPDALLIAFKSVRLRLMPAADGRAVAVAAEPAPAGLDILNLIKPSAAAACGDWKEGLRADVTRHDGHTRLILTGEYPTVCGEMRWGLSVLDHPRFDLGVFRELWTELGGSLAGDLREGPVPAGAKALATTESPPLAEVIRDINKFSNNVMARQLYLTLGAAAGARPSRPEDGEAAIRRWLAERHLRCPALVLENGAGLSRRERIDADCLGRVLAAAWANPLMPEFVASLPIAAIDGTMKKRLHDEGVAGRAHIKTGSLEGVRSIAGYVQDRRGRRRIVVFLVNDPGAGAAQAAEDALLEWVYER